ncbi:MAG: glycosyltransferase [Gilvibacter sp.]
MTFGVFTHVPHSLYQGQYYAYGPYVKEMNLWGNHVDDIILVAPKTNKAPDAIDIAYTNSQLRHIEIPSFSLLGIGSKVKAIFKIPLIGWRIFWAMRKVDHIHLRCPGNIGLIACFVQILFPKKPKTAKYAGNWDPKAKQPWSYRWQKAILSNTLFTKNMQALVYGDWEGRSRNIKPFFTASYHQNQIDSTIVKDFKPPYKFLFIGTLSPGKQPIKAIELVQQLCKDFPGSSLDFYGEGAERSAIEGFITEHQLEAVVQLHGNQPSEQILKAYRSAHFLVLNSLSEGWPKVVAEAMFWGVIPIASAVSCVPWMIDNQTRGILLTGKDDYQRVLKDLSDKTQLDSHSRLAMQWSQEYTLDRFENEIKKLLRP